MTSPVAHLPARLTVLGAGLALVFVVGGGTASAAQPPVGLGTAASFAVLAGSTVTNTGPSLISDGPVLVTVVPARTAKLVAVPRPTGGWAADA